MPDILITGGTGQVGSALGRLSWPEDIHIHTPPRAELDLCSAESISTFFQGKRVAAVINCAARSEEHTSELQSLMRISYAVFCLKKKRGHQTDRRHASRLYLVCFLPALCSSDIIDWQLSPDVHSYIPG